MRNQSIIVDNMQGLFKSVVTCPEKSCNKVSITFDPFLMASLPIPDKKLKKLEIVFIPQNLKEPKLRLAIHFKKSDNLKMREIKKLVYQKIEKEEKETSYFFCSSSYRGESTYISDDSLVNEVKKNVSNYSTLFLRELLPSEIAVTPKNREFISLSFLKLYSSKFKQKSSSSVSILVDTHWSLMQTHYHIFSILSNYFQNPRGNDVTGLYRELFGLEEVPPYTLNYYSNSYGYKNCYYCGKKCDGCAIDFTEEVTIGEMINRIPEKEKDSFSFKIELIWKECEKYNVDPAKLDECEELICKQDKSEVINIYDCFNLFSQPETLNEDNSWYCSNCKQHQCAEKKLEIYQVNQYLIIHLKRFKSVSSMFSRSSRNDTVVDFPLENLDITDFVRCKETPVGKLGEEGEMEIESSNEERLVYDLYGVSNHFGSMSFGHYTAFVKNAMNGIWYNMDDSDCSPVSDLSSIISGAAYVLFYKKK